MTIEVTVSAAVLAVAVALVAGSARSARIWPARAIATAFVEIFRGTSVLVQLYVAYFVLPYFGLALTPFAAGVLALGLNAGSYGAEIVRGGLASVPSGQREAALVLDMPAWQQFRRVILPTALVIIIRPTGNLLIDILKGSSLVSLVTLADLTYQGQVLRTDTGQTAQIFLALLAIYFILSSIIAWLVNRAERHVRRGLDARTSPSSEPRLAPEEAVA